jgi:hypothetical protein
MEEHVDGKIDNDGTRDAAMCNTVGMTDDTRNLLNIWQLALEGILFVHERNNREV